MLDKIKLEVCSSFSYNKKMKTLLNLCIFLSLTVSSFYVANQATIVIDVPGSLHLPGRKIGDYFERGVLLYLVEQVKKQIVLIHPKAIFYFPIHADHLLNHSEQIAHRYNVLDADFLVTFAAYQEKLEPHLYLYQFIHDLLPQYYAQTCAFYSYHQAYMRGHAASTYYAQQSLWLFSQQIYAQQFVTKGPWALPLTPLAGITAPALLIEMGISSYQDIDLFVEPLVAFLSVIISHIELKKGVLL